MDLAHLKIISAGAGSGKTYRLTRELVGLLRAGAARPQGIIATTFTRKAAAELQERVRLKLLEEGLSQEANALNNALIGTVHGLGVKLLRRFAYEAGVSPQVDIMADEDRATWFNQSLSATLQLATIEHMTLLCDRLSLQGWGGTPHDWRGEVSKIVDVARTNNFSPADLAEQRDRSWADFAAFLPEPTAVTREAVHSRLAALLEQTQQALEDQTADTTKKTQDYALKLGRIRSELRRRGELYWKQWASLASPSVGKKSAELVMDLAEYCQGHDRFSVFQDDLRAYCDLLFNLAATAMKEFAAYKQRRGLIDYADMEALVTRLLDHPRVRETLAAELDLLLVDEFQDTSPLQLEIFLKLSALARQSIWVGDPKQSIYGFRGAEPALMRAIIAAAGGIKDENIQEHSWRSRAELVYLSNALFTKAFAELAERQVRLLPVRLPQGNEPHYPPEPAVMTEHSALIHWHFEREDGSSRTSQDWLNDSLAEALAEWLRQDRLIYDKEAKTFRVVRPGDIAILCRTNRNCEAMAAKLNRAGIAAAIAQSGLLQTAEAILILACLKYVLSAEDSLSVAEILLLGSGYSLSEIIEQRIDWLERDAKTPGRSLPWGLEDAFIGKLEDLRHRIRELSSAETLDLLLEELDLRRTIATWGRTEQRLSNVDELRRLARQYEDNCNRRHSAASLGGFLLYLDELSLQKQDQRGASEDPQAVNILTYHRSKGLEWPVVIAHDLGTDLRADLFGLSLVNDRTELQLDDILGGRRLRYWVNPYGRQRRNVRLLEELESSELQAQRRQEQLAEEARLLYVGVTRARDWLIVPSRVGTSSSTGWLDRVFGEGREEPVLDPTTGETPWFWNDEQVLKATRSYSMPASFPAAEPAYGTVPFLAPRAGRLAGRLPYQLVPGEQLEQHPVRVVGQQAQTYHAVPERPEDLDPYEWGRVVKHFLTGDDPGRPAAERERQARDLLRRFELDDRVSVDWLLDQSASWARWCQEQRPAAISHRQYPVNFPFAGQRFTAVLDLVLETPADQVVVQYSSYAGSKWEQRANRLAPFLHFAARALAGATDQPVGATFVNFVNLGMVVEVRTAAA
jgi:ATP-dependent exoDNAse (exonuclease V) beta subunit